MNSKFKKGLCVILVAALFISTGVVLKFFSQGGTDKDLASDEELEELLNERQERGEFNDFFECIARIGSRKISRKQMESLIAVGAMEGFRANRSSLLATLDEAIRYVGLGCVAKDPVEFDYNLVSKALEL